MALSIPMVHNIFKASGKLLEGMRNKVDGLS